jgi:hypothetical protein
MVMMLLVAAGCREAPPEAPEDLDELAHFFWLEMAGDDAELLGAGAVNLGQWFETGGEVSDGWAGAGVDLPPGVKGQLSNLTEAELDILGGLQGEPDPSLAVGVYILAELDCSAEQIVEITLEPDQLSLFPDNYDDYERFFDTDPDCFASGECDVVDWHSAVDDTIAGLWPMSYELLTRVKRYRYADTDGSETELLMARNYMPAPAEENVSAGGFEQSYHVEVFHPWGGDRTLHLYGLWNYGFIDGVSDDVAFWPNQYLDGLIEWDERIQELCTEAL